MSKQPLQVSILESVVFSWRIARAKNTQARTARKYKRQRRRGMWYCAHCGKMHGKRVIEYQIADGLVDSVCSLGRDEYMKFDPTLDDDQQYITNDFRPLVAGHDVAERIAGKGEAE